MIVLRGIQKINDLDASLGVVLRQIVHTRDQRKQIEAQLFFGLQELRKFQDDLLVDHNEGIDAVHILLDDTIAEFFLENGEDLLGVCLPSSYAGCLRRCS